MPEAPRVAGLRYSAVALLEHRAGVAIWRALDALDGGPCVLVVLETGDAEAQASFVRRVLALRAVEHPVLVQLADVGLEGGRAWAVRPWVTGVEVAARVHLLGALAPRQVVEVVRAVVSALAALHEAGLAHGGVAPTRVLLTPEGQVRLVGAAVGAARGDAGPEDDLRAALALVPVLGGGKLPAALEGLLERRPASAAELEAWLAEAAVGLPEDPPDTLPLGAQPGHDGATEDVAALPASLKPSPPPRPRRRRLALAPLALLIGFAAWWWWSA